jgi:hypothetical protein
LLSPRLGTEVVLWTDESKKLFLKFYYVKITSAHRLAHSAWAEARWRPIPNLSLTGRVEYTYWQRELEYAGQTATESGEKIYLLSSIKQDATGFTFRVDYSITPDLSLQFYGSPFISPGRYYEFKRATNTTDKKFENRFVRLDGDALSYDSENNKYSMVEPDGKSYSFDNPDFSFREFRFNLVMRWEYRPNSTVYLVWSQDRSGTASEYIPSLNKNTGELFRYYPNNVFMVKLSYWFSL